MGYGVYLFFASLMILGAVFVFFLIPETKSIPLESIDRLFQPGLRAGKAHKVVWAEVQHDEQALRIGLTEEGLEKDQGVTHLEKV